MLSRIRLLICCGPVSMAWGITGGIIGVKLTNRHPAKEVYFVDRLQLHELDLLDEQGRTRATFALNGAQQPSLDFLDESGRAVVLLGADKSGAHLRLTGSEPMTEAVLGLYGGKPFLGFSGDGREGRVVVGYIHDDDSDPNGMGHWGFSATGLQHRYYLGLGISSYHGNDYDSFAVLPGKHKLRLPSVFDAEK